MAESIPLPYEFNKEVDQNGNILYFFKTQLNQPYVIEFEDKGALFGAISLGCRFFTILLSPIGCHLPPEGTPRDLRIHATVEAVLIDIFSNLNNIVLAICDSSDGREKVRFNLFKRWADRLRYSPLFGQ